MDRDTLKTILREIGVDAGKSGNYKDSGDNVQFCCPFHGETRPSTGINIYTLVGHCFACGTDYNLVKLVAHCLDYTFSYRTVDGIKDVRYDYNRAEDWLQEKFNIEKRKVEIKDGTIIRIDEDVDNPVDNVDKRYEQSLVKIAPFQSGKATHNYFFERGFTKETAKEFKVGWDDIRKRITIPVFWEDGALCGVIGRAVLEMKIDGKTNPDFYKVYKESELNDVKYYIYDKFPVGDILFPLPQFKLINDTVILLEGQFDAMWLHQNGFPNALSSLGSKLSWNRRTQSSKQIELLHKLGAKKIILMRDSDTAGRKGCEHDFQLLKDDFIVYGVTFPDGKTDPQECNKDDIQWMLDNKYLYGMSKKKLRRIK